MTIGTAVGARKVVAVPQDDALAVPLFQELVYESTA
jgi:hypothetical protein